MGSSPTGGDASAGAVEFMVFELDTFLVCLANIRVELRGRTGKCCFVKLDDL